MDPLLSEADAIDLAFKGQQATALHWRESKAFERIEHIRRLKDSMLSHRQSLYDAFQADFHKPQIEVDATEIIPFLDEVHTAIRHLKRWMRPIKVSNGLLTLGNSASIHYQPRGRCLIIAPWNYPVYLSLGPLVSALAAGNTVILKPSELAPRVAAVLAHIIRETFEPFQVAVFEGGASTAQALLDKPFDHIFFTGSPAVGKVVMGAAAKHLSSVTLELGGKSPVIVDETADLQAAAETLMWAKMVNGGQTCIAPDYLYVHESVKEAFLAACAKLIQSRYGTTSSEQQSSADFSRIVNQRHTQRLADLLADALQSGARVRAGGDVDMESHYVAPTLLDSVGTDARILAEEIFGPVLPVLEYRDLKQVIAAINSGSKPLALYVWSKNQKAIDRLLAQTSSGGVCVNHCMVHAAHTGLPFGGVNNSGIGSAHGFFGFKAFSHERSVLRGGWLRVVRLVFPPYTAKRKRVVAYLLGKLSR